MNLFEITISTLPDSVEVYNPLSTEDVSLALVNDSGWKIYTLINTSCATCILQLKEWQDFQKEIRYIKDVRILPICYSTDDFEVLKYWFESKNVDSLNFPLILDAKNQFIKKNSDLVNDLGEFTALVDHNNHILLTGDPIGSTSDRERFLEKIQESYE